MRPTHSVELKWRVAPVVALCGLTVLALFWRRPDQYIQPYIWIEEGNVLRDFAERGISAVFGIINGFPDLVARIILVASFQISILQAPWIGIAATTLFTTFVALSVYLAPTHLRWPFLCAVATLVIPTGPENYAVTLMTFWWAGILILLALIWREDHQGWRRFFIVLGGLSSPIIIPLSALFALRAAWSRCRNDIIAAALAGACALINLATLSGHADRRTLSWELTEVAVIIGKFVGGFASSSLAKTTSAEMIFGAVVVVLLSGLVFAVREKLDRHFFTLVAATIAVIVPTALRLGSPEIYGLHAFQAGPRYLFYPFVLIAWMIIWIAAVASAKQRYVALALLMFGIGQGVSDPYFRWRHDHIDWRASIRACAASDVYDVPVHYMGGAANPPGGGIMWHVRLSGLQCTYMIQHSLF